MTREEFYLSDEAGEEQGWDGTCVTCGHSYFVCRGNCSCLSCNAQRQAELRDGRWFDEDGLADDSNIEWQEAAEFWPEGGA